MSAYARSDNGCGKWQFWGLKKGSGFGERGGTSSTNSHGVPQRGNLGEKKLLVATNVDSSSPTFGSLYVFRS